MVTFKYRGPVDGDGDELEQTTEADAAALLSLLDDLQAAAMRDGAAIPSWDMTIAPRPPVPTTRTWSRLRMTGPPPLVASDDIDPILGTWAAKEMHTALPDSEVIVPGAPHATSESRAFPDGFDEPVAALLAKHPVQDESA